MLALAMVVAAVVTVMCLVLGRRLGAFRTVPNFRGDPVSVAGLSLAAGLASGLAVAYGMNGSRAALAGVVAVAGFALFGALDDAYGDRSTSGFRGHLRAAARGRFTTGFWKIVGGGCTALLASWLLGAPGGWWEMSLRAAVVALGANALNLLDTRPMRATAVFVALCAVTAAAGGAARVVWPGIAAALAWLPWDRAKRAMLGDAGSNALGALWGVAAVANASWHVALALLVVLVAFHAWTESHSLNATIAAHPALDRLDRWVRGEG